MSWFVFILIYMNLNRINSIIINCIFVISYKLLFRKIHYHFMVIKLNMSYIPTMMALGTSIAASVFANHISSTRLAALATAYGITEKKVSEYEEAIKSLNEPNQQKVNDGVIDNYVKDNPPDGGIIEDTGTGSILFIDKETGRRFKASYSHVANAFKRISDNLVTNEEMHINDLYIELELPEQESGNLLGWFPNDWPINPNFIEKTTETGEKYYVITYNWNVLRDFRGY